MKERFSGGTSDHLKILPQFDKCNNGRSNGWSICMKATETRATSASRGSQSLWPFSCSWHHCSFPQSFGLWSWVADVHQEQAQGDYRCTDRLLRCRHQPHTICSLSQAKPHYIIWQKERPSCVWWQPGLLVSLCMRVHTCTYTCPWCWLRAGMGNWQPWAQFVPLPQFCHLLPKLWVKGSPLIL